MKDITLKQVANKASLPSARHNKDAIFQVKACGGALFRSDGDFWVRQTGGIPSGYDSVLSTNNVTGGVVVLAGGASSALGECFYKKSCSDVISGSGVLNGQLTDTGQAWIVGGAGYLTTIISGDHIEGTQNTYCHVNTGSKIAKAIQYYTGAMATVEIGLDSSLSDMIHCNFSSNGLAVISYWKTGVGAAIGPKWDIPIVNCPNINDGMPHKCELHVAGNFALAYCDGILSSIAYDPNFPSITGNWTFAQIHGAGEKIFGIETYSGSGNLDVELPTSILEVVMAKAISCSSITVGNPLGTGFSPSSSSYFWSDDIDGHVFGGPSQARIKAKSVVPGYSAILIAQSAIGTETALRSGNDGAGYIQHQDSDKIKFPFNSTRIEVTGPLALPVYTVSTLPAATVAYQRAFVSDALSPAFGATVSAGGAVKVPVYSDGVNWKVG